MNKLFLCLLSCCALTRPCAQTLFSYGDQKVAAPEFLYAFHTNNPQAGAHPPAAALNTYLQLFINYKLKVQAAKDAGLDKSPDFIKDVNNFQSQLVDQDMKRLEGIGFLSREALLRGQTDIEIAQVFVSFPTPIDTQTAWKRINEALDQLKKGVSFETVATNYGTNPVLKDQKGYTGFITVFSLPYEAETMVYNLPDGGYSGIYKSRSGYHLFKRISHRLNPGSLEAAQILVAFSPSATPAEKSQVRKKAYEIDDSLQKGASFDSLVRKYSDDKISYYNYGRLPEFTTGDFDRSFETAAFALPKDGAIGQPVETAYGYHIIKRIWLNPPLRDSLDTKRWAALQQKVYYNDRMDFSRDMFAEKALPRIGFHTDPMDTAWLYRTADTLLTKHGGEDYIKKTTVRPLFSFKGKAYSTVDWLRYLLYRRSGDLRTGPFNFPVLERDFIRASALEYYSAHLGDFDPAYRYQFQEFSEGSLLFAVMQQEVWNKAGEDSAALQKWFDAHREKFILPRSADVIAFNIPDSIQGADLAGRIRRSPAQWRILLGNYVNANADSARYELGALSLDSNSTTDGLMTPLHLQPDNKWHFYYIIKTYPSVAARSFDDAKGLVLSDYQAWLEQKWLSALREKYHVTINQSEFQHLAK